ncbi:molybdenum cofactor guanylyltransferase [Colwellia sp. MEBiC06753]
MNHGCIGIVLAGGRSSRMGTNKALLKHNNQTMLEFSKSLLEKAGVDQILVSGEALADTKVIADIQPHLGPVGGIYSVFNQQVVKAALIIPVDLPLMTVDVLKQLKQAGQLLNKAVAFNDHSLPLYLPNTAYSELFFNQAFKANQSNGKGPSIKALLSQVPFQNIVCSAPKTLTNANTPEQWQHIQSQLNSPIRSK